MAKQTKDTSLIINQIQLIQLQRQKIAIDKWRKALQSAENVRNPLRRQLLEIYKEILLDAHVYAIIDKRIKAVTRQRIRYTEEGKNTTELNKLFESPWFGKVVKHTMQSIFWGYSLMEFVVEKGEIVRTILIPREHVRPELGIVVRANASENAGFEYRLPPYDRYTFEVYIDDELGLLNIAACNVILKRGGTIDYANFIEMFGQPIRQYEYDPSVPGAREETKKVADESGNSAAIVTPKDWTTLTLHQINNSAGASVHAPFLQALKEELSILILGQTMTTQDGSSRSQAQVHQQEQDKITQDDMQFVLDQLNFFFKPKLEALGYPVSGGMFQFDQTDNTPIDVQLTMDLQIKAAGIPIDDDYFYEKYKIPKPSGKQAAAQKKKPSEQTLVHGPDCGCGELAYHLDYEKLGLFEGIQKLFRKVFKQELKAGDLDEKTFVDTYQTLIDGMDQGYGDIRPDYEQPDTIMLEKLDASTAIFAAHKNAAFIKSLVEALKDSNGELVKWTEFRKAALQIHQNYNVTYLETEYNQAIAAAQAARLWVQIEADAEDFPNLKYSTVGDNNVRPAHQKLEGIVRPVNDPIWNVIYPPSAWRCRCTVQQMDADAELTTDTKLRSAVKQAAIEPQWQNNVGKTGKPFGENYEYYQQLTEEERKKAEQFAKDNGNQ
jgi:SPP1 gp7 family putative phage head morphogenesis protein